MTRLFLLPGIVLFVMLCITAWLYLRLERAEDASWRATCGAVQWQTKANALESQLQRRSR